MGAIEGVGCWMCKGGGPARAGRPAQLVGYFLRGTAAPLRGAQLPPQAWVCWGTIAPRWGAQLRRLRLGALGCRPLGRGAQLTRIARADPFWGVRAPRGGDAPANFAARFRPKRDRITDGLLVAVLRLFVFSFALSECFKRTFCIVDAAGRRECAAVFILHLVHRDADAHLNFCDSHTAPLLDISCTITTQNKPKSNAIDV